MIKPETRQLLVELGKTQYGKALRDFLDEQVKEVGDITKATSWDDTLGRKHFLTFVSKLYTVLEEKDIAEKSRSQYD